MSDYISTHTGEQIDSAVNAVANKQDTLVSGTNIKTINNESLLGSGNITIQGGGGDLSVRIVDATNPEDWDIDNDGPTQDCIEDIATGSYQIIHIINVPVEAEEDGTYEIIMLLTAAINIEGYQIRAYSRYDSGDEDEGTPPFMQSFQFSKIGDDIDMQVEQAELGGGGSTTGIYLQTCELGGQDNDIVSLNLSEITDAIDNGSEVIIKVNGTYGYDTRYFRVETLPLNGKTTIDGDDYWTPTFRCVSNISEYYMDYDGYVSESFNFKIHKGAVRFTPTTLDMDTQTIVFDIDDYSYMFGKQPKHLTLNLDEDGGEFWVDFDKVIIDETPGDESYTYTSGIIPISTDFFVFKFRVYMNIGNIATEITANKLTVTTPV